MPIGLNDVDLWMDIDAEFLVHIAAYGIAERHHLLSGGVTTVDKYEGLFVMNSCASERTAFPSTLVYHPPGWNFLVTLIYIIMWHVWIPCLYLLKHTALHNRVHEETTCIALHFRVGQFGVSDVDNDLPKLCGRWKTDVAALQFGTNVAVVQQWLEAVM